MRLLGHALRYGGVAIAILANLPPPYGWYIKHRPVVIVVALLVSVVGAYMNDEVINFVR